MNLGRISSNTGCWQVLVASGSEVSNNGGGNGVVVVNEAAAMAVVAAAGTDRIGPSSTSQL